MADDVAAQTDETTELLDAYKALNLSPQELGTVLDHYLQLVDQKDKPAPVLAPAPKPKAPPLTKGKPNTTDLRAELLEIFPELSKITDLDGRLKQTEEHTQDLRRNTFESTKDQAKNAVIQHLATEHSADTTSAVGQKLVNTVIRMVGDTLAASPEALEKFLKGDLGTVKTILKDYEKEGVFAQLNIPKGKTLPYLHRGDNDSGMKDILEANAEKLKGMTGPQRFNELSKAIYDRVWVPQ